MIAGVKYKKTYYEDRDLKPSENLFLAYHNSNYYLRT